jgi:hypothetical protein
MQGITDILSREKQISEDLYGMLEKAHQKGYHEIEEFRQLLEARVKEREKMYAEFYKMLAQLHDQMDELSGWVKSADSIERKVALVDHLQASLLVEMFVEEINMMANMVHRMIDFNRNIERKTPWE